MGGPPPGASYGHPPTYGGGQPQLSHRDSHGPGAMGHPMGRQQAAEVEGTNRSKAQLIVGIDFVSTLICLLYCGVGLRKSGLTGDVG